MPQKTVLITGCSDGGIGAALAAEFQLRGLRVLATARDPSKMAGLAALNIETLALDVTSESSIEQAVGKVREKLNDTNGTEKRLDFLINNAGMAHIMPLSDSRISDWKTVMDTNVIGPLAVTQAFIPLLMRRSGSKDERDETGKSTVVMLGSITEVFCPPYQAVYAASKAAIRAAARTLRVELAPLGINCVTLMTGSVRSNLFENAPTKVPDQSLYSAVADRIEKREFLEGARWIDADEFARRIADDLLKPTPKPVIWRGGLATVASWLAWLGWEGMLDSAVFKANHLDEIRPQA
ncbi:hypothetical protein F4802DRAFT_593365 [Xylaria palmicola]|nr:hypothetical protein F4802DRAFT_593365 [Xylaria palmicola]